MALTSLKAESVTVPRGEEDGKGKDGEDDQEEEHVKLPLVRQDLSALLHAGMHYMFDAKRCVK